MNSIDLIKRTVFDVFPFVLLGFIGFSGIILGMVLEHVILCAFFIFLGFLSLVTLIVSIGRIEEANT